jgi:hypothetical protein
MIAAGTSPPNYINLGKDEPGMKLQRFGGREWVDYKVNGKVVTTMWLSATKEQIRAKLIWNGYVDLAEKIGMNQA